MSVYMIKIGSVHYWAVPRYYFLFFGGPSPKLKKMSKFVQTHLVETIYAKKLSKGGGKVGFSETPKIGKLAIFKERYKCYTFSETSGQPLKEGEEKKKSKKDRKITR